MPSRDVVASINISSLAAAAAASTLCEWVTVVLVLVIDVLVSTPLLVCVWFALSTVCFSVVAGADTVVDGNDDAVDWSVDGVVKSLFSNFPVDEANDDVVEGDSVVVVESSSQLFG